MNKVILCGRLTRDPDTRHTQNGKIFIRSAIAVPRPFSKDKDVADFFNFVAWEKTAEFIGKYFQKGSRILIEGRLQTSSYENKDGVKVNAVDVLVENVEFADAKKPDDSTADKPAEKHADQNNRDDYSVDPPFDPNDTPF